MIKLIKNKYDLKNRINFAAFFIVSPLFFANLNAYSSTSLMVSGHAGIVGQSTYNTPPVSSNYAAFRVPIGLVFEVRPSDNFSLYLGLDYAYNNYPGPSTLLGQNGSAVNGTNDNKGLYSLLPFSNSITGNTPYSQNTDIPTLTQAYFTYQTAIGLFSAGRMPRNWGLGVWRNAEWTPYGGLPSTTDSLSLFTDFNAFDLAFYYEKYGEGIGGTSNDSDANAYTLEARLKSDLADAPSTGVSQEFGITYSRFSHNKSNTVLSILDVYTKFYISKFFIGAEVLYPSGHTQSPNYQNLGGASACNTSTTDVTLGSQTCVNQNFDGALAALLKMKYQIGGNANSSIASIEKSQKVLGTTERESSHIVGFWAGYASGGSNQFDAPGTASSSNQISAIAMNSNIQPSFLMFNNTMPAIKGMPGGAITNATFVRLDYTYENPIFGSVGPTFVWATLNQTNKSFNANNSLCSNTSLVVDPNSSANVMCVGGSKELGAEIDISYRYTTLDRVTFGVDGGYWFVGKAWDTYGGESQGGNYGLRASVSTQF